MTIHLHRDLQSAEGQYSSVPNPETFGNCSLWYYGGRAGKRLHCSRHWWNRCITDFFLLPHLNLKDSTRSLRAAKLIVHFFPNCPLLNRLVCSYSGTLFLTCFLLSSTMRMLQVKASPSRLKGGTFPLKPLWVAQWGQFNRLIERESPRQTIVNLMFFF